MEEWNAFDDPNKLNLYTVIRRDENGALKTVWYRDEYKEELEKVCALLEEAATLTTNEGMRTYLTERVKAFRTDDYLASDMAWMDMKDCNMDLVIGPIENYDDHLFEAKAAYEGAKPGEAAARSSYELAKAGAQREDKQASSAMVRVARAGVSKANALLEDQYLIAPYDGVITVIYPNTSELIATGAPVMTLQKDDHWAVFNVRETLLKDIKLGSELKVYIPALDKDTVMKVFYIKDLGTYANWQATKATGDYDARTFQIKCRPDKPVEKGVITATVTVDPWQNGAVYNETI